MIGLPTFILVLGLLLPAWDYVRGPGGVAIAFLAAVGAAWALERWVGRNRRPPSREPAGPRPGRPMEATRPGSRRLVLIGLGLVALAYVVFVLAMSRGGA